jgi:hypothetical protein
MAASITAALELLRWHRLPLTFSAARDCLEQYRDRANLLALYEHYFPQEYAASTAGVRPAKGAVYSARELEFFELVNARLFPLPLDVFLDEYDGVRSAALPVMTFGIDWWLDSVADLRPGWQLLLLLAGEVEITDVEVDAHFLKTYVKGIKPRPPGSRIDWDAFKAACESAGEALTPLPLALDVLSHDTGNIWLDPSDETPVMDAEWCVQDMDVLTREYQEAQQMLRQADQVLDWIEASPAHYGKVIALWNHARKVRRSSPPA